MYIHIDTHCIMYVQCQDELGIVIRQRSNRTLPKKTKLNMALKIAMAYTLSAPAKSHHWWQRYRTSSSREDMGRLR